MSSSYIYVAYYYQKNWFIKWTKDLSSSKYMLYFTLLYFTLLYIGSFYSYIAYIVTIRMVVLLKSFN
ncbi:hypothetical protein CANARDRAFT_113075 [[Candida] arabinofermentans NRRL YB-2248]|uniref:Uncharacterized protein n=1 Tax=[Candida] arabinofermentans NRRL YB-2248 TaxID=983967 RepID=A0A1E4T4G1_9ASCO|nr:hypothetical protein CANARDRAFT_113075 [[Candida] arabinofermentans NRRL YB-2248]